MAKKTRAILRLRRRPVRWPLLSLVAALASLAPVARANGRFPRAERLLEDPQDARHLVLAATYGLLTTDDRGGSWYHVCEESFGEAGVQTDPVVTFLPSGELLTSIYSSLAFSQFRACDFHKTLSGPGVAVPDYTLDAAGDVLALVVDPSSGQPGPLLERSRDQGRHFELVSALPVEVRLAATVDVAPSRPQRLYVSGLTASGAGVLLRSDDAGKSFVTLPVPTAAESDETPYIAAVSANDPDVVYVRTDVWKYDELEGVAYAADALLYSDDGGESFLELFRARGKLFGFALAPDESELLLGFGDPVAGGGRFTDPDALGIYRGVPGGSDFVKLFQGSVSCLTWTGQGIYACTSQSELGFALGRATTEGLQTALSFEPMLSLGDVKGPLSCPACSSGSACVAAWSAVCSSWGRSDCEASPGADDAAGGRADCADTAGAGGAGENASTSGGAPAMANPPLQPAGAGGQAEVTQIDGARSNGCACRASSRRPRGLLLGGLFALTALLRRRRSVAALALLGAVGCAGDPSPSEDAAEPAAETSPECAGDFDTYESGMSRQAEPGDLNVELVESDPAPPAVRHDNVWLVHLSDAAGEPLLGAEVQVTPWMPKHQHGTSEVVVEELGDGDYRLDPIDLVMPGVWEIPVSVTPPDAETSEMTFRFCIAER